MKLQKSKTLQVNLSTTQFLEIETILKIWFVSEV